MDLGFGRAYVQQQENSPIEKIRGTPVAQRSWRMNQTLLSNEQSEQAAALMSKRDQDSRLRGLALAIAATFNAVGHPFLSFDMHQQVAAVVNELRNDPKNFTEIVRPHGRLARACNMKASHYIVLMAGEALAAFSLWGITGGTSPDAGMSAPRHSGRPDAQAIKQAEATALVHECTHRVLMRLSGNLASALTNADGTPNAAMAAGSMTSINFDGVAVPADVVMTKQLLIDFDLHPKKIAWVMHDILYQVAKTPALASRHAASLAQMSKSADAMVGMASNPSGKMQDPKEAAAAALAATSASVAMTPWAEPEYRTALASAAPETASTEEAMMALARNFSVKHLKEALSNAGIPHSHCVEKEELVALMAKVKGSGMHTAAHQQQQQRQQIPPSDPLLAIEPCDISPWLHMALFLRAEAAEADKGRTRAVIDMYRAAVAAVRGSRRSSGTSSGGGSVAGSCGTSSSCDDEMYGCLVAWNAVRALTDGGTPFKAGEGLELLGLAAGCKARLKRWQGYESIQPRIKVMEKQCLKSFKSLIAAAREASGQQASSSSSITIADAEVRQLVRPGEEQLLLRPNPVKATVHAGVVKLPSSAAKPCANCKHAFHTLKVCTGCRVVEYCGKECQTAHWKQHKAECKRLKEEKEAAAAAAAKTSKSKK